MYTISAHESSCVKFEEGILFDTAYPTQIIELQARNSLVKGSIKAEVDISKGKSTQPSIQLLVSVTDETDQFHEGLQKRQTSTPNRKTLTQPHINMQRL